MYIATFYSFKGGVGRTMSMVNVAVELANRGKRVLMVDFDLEAPGLDTFDLGRPNQSSPGMVDFVREYLDTGIAPDVAEFLFESPGFSGNGSGLWIMPAGAQDSGYAGRLASIDWNDLYERHDGFLLFEDLKLQWRAEIDPDYVLLDSRTGYTDVGGICTRHLPDAVVILFFPNEQNLRGLTKVVHDIRAEADGVRAKQIDLHFVLSNVPDLDDEDAILEKIIRSFRENLDSKREPLAIHRYASLSLLNQTIFTKDRPKSRLARQYRRLASRLVRYNVDDRDGALDFLSRRAGMPSRRSPRRWLGRGDGRSGDYLERIEERHQKDGEILFRLGQIQADRGDFEKFVDLVDRAIDEGYREPEAWLARARHRRWQENDSAGASSDALAVFRNSDASFPDVNMALRLLLPEDLEKVPDSEAVVALPDRERILMAGRLTRSKKEAELARTLLRPLLANDKLEAADLARARQAAILALLALGRFKEAVTSCLESAPSLDAMTVQDAFNYGMALWAQQREPPRDPFARVLELDALEPPDAANANYAQCLGVAHWAMGNTNTAQETLARAESRIRTERSSFSCWRYLEVPARLFLQDLQEMRRMVDGDQTVKPQFMRQPRNREGASAARPTSSGEPTVPVC